ncbi:ornithine cyclodeaminase family protein [Halobacteriaceae archaeon GCM10025711]
MVRILSDRDVASVLDLAALLPVVETAFRKQGRGEVERPERPHFPVGTGLDPDRPDDPLGTALTMPAYVHGADHYATKLVGVHEGNADRGLPTVNAQIALTDAATGLPSAYLAGTRITNARTGCIGGLAVRDLATGPVTLGIIGAGTQARWQARAIAAATDVESIRVYSPSDSRVDCARDLSEELDVVASPVETPTDAVDGADVVVTATTSTTPVFPGEALDPGTLVVAVGAYTSEMQELDAATFDRAARVFADVPEEVAGIGDVRETGVDPDALVPLSAVFEGDAGRESDDEILVVDSVGTAVLDAATAEWVFDAAAADGVGTKVGL